MASSSSLRPNIHSLLNNETLLVTGVINANSILNELSGAENSILNTAAPVCLACRNTLANAPQSK